MNDKVCVSVKKKWIGLKVYFLCHIGTSGQSTSFMRYTIECLSILRRRVRQWVETHWVLLKPLEVNDIYRSKWALTAAMYFLDTGTMASESFIDSFRP